MTKIVVVVDSTEHYKEFFEGENIYAYDGSGASNTSILTIYKKAEETNKPDTELASFKEWTYWRYTD